MGIAKNSTVKSMTLYQLMSIQCNRVHDRQERSSSEVVLERSYGTSREHLQLSRTSDVIVGMRKGGKGAIARDGMPERSLTAPMTKSKYVSVNILRDNGG